jgi:hypothetical protein
VWFHIATGSNFGYDGTSANTGTTITSFSFGKQGWYDVANQNAETGTSTTVVSSPSVIAFLLMGFASVVFLRRK